MARLTGPEPKSDASDSSPVIESPRPMAPCLRPAAPSDRCRHGDQPGHVEQHSAESDSSRDLVAISGAAAIDASSDAVSWAAGAGLHQVCHEDGVGAELGECHQAPSGGPGRFFFFFLRSARWRLRESWPGLTCSPPWVRPDGHPHATNTHGSVRRPSRRQIVVRGNRPTGDARQPGVEADVQRVSFSRSLRAWPSGIGAWTWSWRWC